MTTKAYLKTRTSHSLNLTGEPVTSWNPFPQSLNRICKNRAMEGVPILSAADQERLRELARRDALDHMEEAGWYSPTNSNHHPIVFRKPTRNQAIAEGYCRLLDQVVSRY